MSAVISRMLGKRPEEVSRFISNSERKCGYPGEDIRLLSEIAAEVKQKTRELGLDPADTTHQELYYNLRSKAIKDSHKFGHSIGLNSNSDPITRLEEIFDYFFKHETVLALKKSSAKKLLTNTPPKQLMKKLRYRTIESMIKREDISSLFVVAFNTESRLWTNKFKKSAKSLALTDFQEKPLELVTMSPRISVISTQSIAPAYLTGTVVLNSAAKFNSQPLLSTLRIVHAANKVVHWALALKQYQLSQDLPKFVAEHINNEPAGVVLLEDLSVSFSDFYKNYSLPIKKLAELHLPLRLWENSNHLASLTKKAPVSLNVEDILSDNLSGREYSDRRLSNFSQVFWRRLIHKYLQHPSFEAEMLGQLNPEAITSEGLDYSNEYEPKVLLRTA